MARLNKQIFLIFTCGLFLLISLNAIKADTGACNMECGSCSSGNDSCQNAIMTNLNTNVPYRTTKLGIIGSVSGNASCANSWQDAQSCSDTWGQCLGSAFPSGNNGQSCTAQIGCLSGLSCDYRSSQGGVWDAGQSQCVTCNGMKESTIFGNTSSIYYSCENPNGISGNGKCESACGAAESCDEKSPGDSCGTAGEICQDDCTCEAICSAGSCCDLSTGTFKSAGALCGYSDFNGCNGVCQKKRDIYKCSGISADCPTSDQGDDFYSVGNGYVCSGGQEVNPSTANYCSLANVCTANSCSGFKAYRACNGYDFCRNDNTSAFMQSVYAANGYVLTSACGTQGTGYCAVNQCGEPSMPGLKCSMTCNGSGNCSSATGCTYHCTNGVSDCDETGIDTGGSCTFCSGSLSLSASSGSGTCAISASMRASSCNGKNWEIKDSSGTVKCSGTVSASSYSYDCTQWSVVLGTHAYRLFIDGVQKDTKEVICSNAPFVFSVATNPVSNSVAPGNSVSLSANVTLVSGSPASVSLAASSLPANVTVSFVPSGGCTPGVAAPCSVQMLVQTAANTVPGVYSIYISGTSGSQTQSTVYGLTVTSGITQPKVTTDSATFTQNSATLTGTLVDTGNAPVCWVWFEWGETADLGKIAPFSPIMMTKAGAFSAIIADLSGGSKHYFKAKAKCGGSW